MAAARPGMAAAALRSSAEQVSRAGPLPGTAARRGHTVPAPLARRRRWGGRTCARGEGAGPAAAPGASGTAGTATATAGTVTATATTAGTATTATATTAGTATGPPAPLSPRPPPPAQLRLIAGTPPVLVPQRPPRSGTRSPPLPQPRHRPALRARPSSGV
ncbi:translation initiation factor IF-2-like [Myiozetetes cayanensis]|uniref:translation initiation factor IF-2-like n=1 Tax=Myiozetetes cayanensis TaxID=478635 RepID=UPI00215F8ADC|nr:translation initiation factor IF-2-like [Myiozetetes cayanensis]